MLEIIIVVLLTILLFILLLVLIFLLTLSLVHQVVRAIALLLARFCQGVLSFSFLLVFDHHSRQASHADFCIKLFPAALPHSEHSQPWKSRS